MKMIKLLGMLLVLCGSCFFMPHAKASCSSPEMPYSVSLASISVPSTLTPGRVIPGTQQTVAIHGSCTSGHDGDPIIACYYGTGAESTEYPGVYDTGVPGVGITLINQQGQRVRGGGVNCDTRSTPLGYVSTDGSDTFGFDVTLALIKTATDVSTGTLIYNQTKFGIGDYRKEGVGDPNTISYTGNVIVKEVTCAVASQNLTVTLGDFPQSQFTGIGSTTNFKDFDISLTCNETVTPEVLMSSANGYETNYPGVVKLTPEDGAATGIGVEMTVNGMAATFDQYVSMNTKTVSNEAYTIPLMARYYQTAPQVTPGTANTVVTVSLAYN